LRRSAGIAVAFTLEAARAAQNFGAVAPASKPENGGRCVFPPSFRCRVIVRLTMRLRFPWSCTQKA